MPNREYISCDRLRNGIDFELDNIEVCCFRCHKGGGIIPLSSIVDGVVDFDEYFYNRKKLIEENKENVINPKCDGCFNLEKKQWDDEPCIKYIHFNHWTYCNSKCMYCYTSEGKYNNGTQHYRALPILKEILKRVKFSPDGEITFAGGEPTLLDEFDEIIEYLLEIGAKKIIVHSSGAKYSPALERAIKENIVQLVISQDSGFEETYKEIKNTDNYYKVWENIKQYSQFQGENKNVKSKYVIIPNINDRKEELNEWIKKSQEAGVKKIILDVEHNFYEQHKNDFNAVFSLISLCEYVKNKAQKLGIEVEFYNACVYLYQKYKFLVPFLKYKYYFLELLILAFPILLGNIGHTLIGVTDIFVVAKYSIDSLAAISIANAILFTIFIFGIGIQDAIYIILSNKRGAKERIKKYLPSSLAFSLILGLIFSMICYSTIYLVDIWSFSENIIPDIKNYIKIVSFSMFGLFLFQGIKVFLQAYEIVKMPNIMLLVAVLINLVCDFMFVFGFGPIPAMGTEGAAFATLAVRSVVGLLMLCCIYKKIDFKEKLDFSYMFQLLKIGTPIGFALLLEFFAFNIITMLVGKEASVLAATHNILITISSTTFTVPLAISTAVAIKVAYNYGAKKCDEIKKYSYAGLFMGVSFMALCGLILALFPQQLIEIFTNNQEVMNIALPVILVAAAYQVFDGFQVIAGGILKGFEMTKIVSACVLIGYWFVGMPVAYYFVFNCGYSLKGYWIALAVALFFMGFVQAIFAKHKFAKVKNECR